MGQQEWKALVEIHLRAAPNLTQIGRKTQKMRRKFALTSLSTVCRSLERYDARTSRLIIDFS